MHLSTPVHYHPKHRGKQQVSVILIPRIRPKVVLGSPLLFPQFSSVFCSTPGICRAATFTGQRRVTFPRTIFTRALGKKKIGGSHQHLPSTCLLTSTKRGDRNHPSLGSDDDASSTVDKLLPIRTQLVTQVFLHRVRGWKSSRRLGFREQDPVQGDTTSSCPLGSQDLHLKSAAAERELE